MKKVINITIGKIVFFIEEEAYEKLSMYLESIKNHFKNNDDSNEIVEDIENSIAEKFMSSIKDTKNSISLKDVENVIKEMGAVEDFEIFENSSSEEDTQKTKKEETKRIKRFYRNGDDVIIAGVASGIAAYLDIDPTIVRVLFILSVFFGGFGIILYIILWLVTPLATTTAQKLEMRGEPVNLSNIKEFVEDKFGPEKKTKTKNFINRLVGLLGNFIKILIKVLGVLVGLGVMVVGIVGIISFAFVFSNLLFNINSPLIDFPIQEIFAGTNYTVPLVSLFIFSVIPMFFLIFAGTVLMRRKFKLSLVVVISLLTIWFTSFIVASVYGVKIAPQIEQKVEEIKSQEKITRVYDLKDFDSINVDGKQNVSVVKGDSFSVEISGGEKNLDILDISLNDKTLEIKSFNRQKVCIFCFDYFYETDITITMPSLVSYSSNGVVKSVIKDFNQPEFRMDTNGVSNTYVDIIAKEIFLTADGVSKINLTGSADYMDISLDGVSNVNASDFAVKNIKLEADGPNTAMVWAKNTLDVDLSGPTKVFYKGNPEITKRLDGISKLKKME